MAMVIRVILNLFVFLLICAEVSLAADATEDSVVARASDGQVILRTRRPSGKVADYPPYAPDEILVRFRNTASAAMRAAIHGRFRANTIKRFRHVNGLELVKLPRGASIEMTLKSYRDNRDVLYAEPNYLVEKLGVPNDPSFPLQWNLQNTGQNGGTPGADIKAVQAWDITTGSSTVVVAVIDTGIDYNHQDLAANMWRNEADCNNNGIDDDGNGYIDDCYGIDTFNDDSDPTDDDNHGTHVGGIIGAVGNNSLGVVGVNWNVKIMACKFIGADGFGTTADAIDCLEYVKTMKDRGVNIVATNNSWGGAGFSRALNDAIDTQRQADILFITAAGNAATNNDLSTALPCGFYLPTLICVAANDRFDGLAVFSNYGKRTVHLGAPGHEILSTIRANLYESFSGTSMATPHVAAVAALLKAQEPTRDWRAVKNLILSAGINLPSMADTVTGRRLDAHASLTCSSSVVLSRLLPVTNALISAVGTPIDLSALHINCAVPNGDVNVTVNPGGQVVTLSDNGLGPDLVSGDGIYSGQWAPAAEGIFTVTFPGGDVVAVKVISGQSPALFRPYVKFPIGSRPEAVAIGDVNGDGRNDVVLTSSFYFDPINDFRLHVFLQNSNGELDPPVKYDTGGSYGNRPVSVAIGDVNNDGRADVVVGNAGSNIAVFLQNASGGLDPAVIYPTTNSYLVKVVDVNDDGLLDIVGHGGGSVEVFFQNGSGSLDTPVKYEVGTQFPHGLEVADVNHDGLKDIIVMSEQQVFYPGIGVLYQNPNGTFAPPVYYDLGVWMPFTGGLAVGDINSDGRSDAVMTYGGNQDIVPPFVGLFLQDNSGSLASRISYPSFEIPSAVQIADVNNDGRNDIIVLHSGWLAFGVFLQAPNGTFFPYELYSTNYALSNPQAMAVGDINGDGLKDVVLADWHDVPGLVVHYNDPTASRSPRTVRVVKFDNGQGIVTSNVGGINCGPDCSEAYGYGLSVTFKAAPAAGSTFEGWGWFPSAHPGCKINAKGECTVIIFEDLEIWASFSAPRQLLHVAKSGIGSGTVTSSPPGIDCGPDCDEMYLPGTIVTLTAVPTPGSKFAGWSGSCGGMGTCVLTMSSTMSVTATFTMPLGLDSSSLPEGEVGAAYNTSLAISGGFPPYTVAVTKGYLPPGLNLGSPTIVGTPTVAGTKRFTITVTDQLGSSAGKRFTLQIYSRLKVATLALAAGKVGRVYNKGLKAKGGPAPYSWSLLPGAPAWLSLSATGKITGTPTDAGTFNATFQVTDPLGGQAQKSFTFKIK